MLEYGVKIDCVKNGCDPHHEDDGRVFPEDGRLSFTGLPLRINGHAVSPVCRTIGEWQEVEDAEVSD